MFEITITRTFAAAHALKLHDGSLEPLHGHNWAVELGVAADELDSIEVVMDFHNLQRIVDNIIAPFQNGNLNDSPPFADEHGTLEMNPSAERVAWWLGTQGIVGGPRKRQRKMSCCP